MGSFWAVRLLLLLVCSVAACILVQAEPPCSQDRHKNKKCNFEVCVDQKAVDNLHSKCSTDEGKLYVELLQQIFNTQDSKSEETSDVGFWRAVIAPKVTAPVSREVVTTCIKDAFKSSHDTHGQKECSQFPGVLSESVGKECIVQRDNTSFSVSVRLSNDCALPEQEQQEEYSMLVSPVRVDDRGDLTKQTSPRRTKRGVSRAMRERMRQKIRAMIQAARLRIRAKMAALKNRFRAQMPKPKRPLSLRQALIQSLLRRHHTRWHHRGKRHSAEMLREVEPSGKCTPAFWFPAPCATRH